jgi:hypothetical protein
MPEGQQKASLKDVLNYDVETYFTPDEISFIKSTFKDNKKIIAVLRKALIPTFSDPDLPLEEVGKDMWMAGINMAQVPQDELKILVLARQEAIKFIVGALIQLKMLANTKEESPMEAALRRSKDSTK